MQLNREITPQERVKALIAQASATAPEAPLPQAPQPEAPAAEPAPRPVSLIDLAEANHANQMELGRMIQAQSQVIEAIAQAVGEIHAALYQTRYTEQAPNPQQFDSDF